jgi:hypothetical protein
MKTMFAAFLGGIALLAPMSANARNPPKPNHRCPPGEHWVLSPAFLHQPAQWWCAPNKQPPPPR